ncbi:hypothetical protein [Intestinimonas butyriciproducens]|uniref:hypothetical protein n=1 Tax=Intestinimonas butyriciproducens TaxID=1297617 RepID=UPI0018AB91B4|nr:hypothetical protein [Intestinimonas butyriciproducens]MDB7815937.1 hypothetical protein [Intestinimonas butyriciproducens]MDB7843293.1 hypothetical protein [Intestinimonas butyriciproducens]MDB7856959.1 hypothetical protein [Intestinimonas butyriciproducens]
MSALFYIASDYPLDEVSNPHYKTLSVNEALSIGMEGIPEQFLEPGFDRDKPDVLLWSDAFVEEGELDDDFSIWPLNSSTEDIFTDKKYRVCLEWEYTRGRAERIIQYIREHLSHISELEIWHIWVGNGVYPKIRKCTIPIDELTPDDLKELSDLEVYCEPITHYCFVITAS